MTIYDTRAFEFRAKQIQQKVILVDDLIVSPPTKRDNLDNIVYYEQPDVQAFYSSLTPGAVFELEKRYSPIRFHGSVYGDEAAFTANATMDYHLIELKDFPDLRVLHDYKNNQNNYNRLRRQAEDDANVSYTHPGIDRIDEILLDVFKQPIDSVDFETISAWLHHPMRSEFMWLTVSSDEVLCHHLICVRKTPMGTVCWSIFAKAERGYVSLSTFHLLKWLTPDVADLFDMWNVAVTPREAYKKMFFTAKYQAPLRYVGHNPYTWLHTKD